MNPVLLRVWLVWAWKCTLCCHLCDWCERESACYSDVSYMCDLYKGVSARSITTSNSPPLSVLPNKIPDYTFTYFRHQISFPTLPVVLTHPFSALSLQSSSYQIFSVNDWYNRHLAWCHQVPVCPRQPKHCHRPVALHGRSEDVQSAAQSLSVWRQSLSVAVSARICERYMYCSETDMLWQWVKCCVD